MENRIEKRIFIATKKDLSIGAVCSVQEKKATSFKTTYQSTQQGFSGAREVALATVVEQLAKMNTDEFSVPAQVFVISSLYDMIKNETYKYWLLTGKKNDGTPVHEAELALWSQFNELMSAKGLFFTFKNLIDCNFKGTPKFNKATIEFNMFYYKWAWKKVHEVYPQGPAEPSEPAEPQVG